MTNLNDIIDTAAKAYARKHGRKEIGYYALNFEAGASWATTDPLILQAILQPFAEWLRLKYIPVDELVWKEKWSQSGTIYTIAELLEKYIQHLQTNKQKEDGK